MKIKIFIVEYQDGNRRRRHPESLSAVVAYAFGRELATLGRKPTVHRIDLPAKKIDELLETYSRSRLK